MRLTLRLDDITPDMDHSKFLRMMNILENANIWPLLGVVPENRDENLAKDPVDEGFWEEMRAYRKKGASIAMHGLHHVYDTEYPGLFPLNSFSEFAGHSFEEQLEKIRRGKEILKEHDLETDIFMAPGHSFDKNTLKALKQEGFYYITDGFGAGPFFREHMVFLPISFRKKTSLDPGTPGVTTLVYHTNEMGLQEFNSLAQLLQNKRKQFFSYGELLQMKATTRGIAGNTAEYFSAKMKSLLVKRGLH